MKAREFVRKHVIPAGGVLERTAGDHHVYRFPNGRTFDVPMGGRQTEASHFLLPKLRRLLRASGAAAAVVLAVLFTVTASACGGAPFTSADGPVPDGGGQEDAAREDAPAVSVAQDSPATDTGSHVVSPEAATDAASEGGHDGSSGSSGGSSSSGSSGSSSSSSSGGASSSGSSSGSGSSSSSSSSSGGGSSSSSGGPVCSDGAVRCAGSAQPQICASGAWVNETACSGTSPVCSNGLCVACAPSQTRCTSTTQPQTCSSAGAWVNGAACTNQTCVSGACAGVCAPNQVQCSGAAIQSCGTSGTWQSTSCPSGTTCGNSASGPCCGYVAVGGTFVCG